jgi:hypothetical protein
MDNIDVKRSILNFYFDLYEYEINQEIIFNLLKDTNLYDSDFENLEEFFNKVII